MSRPSALHAPQKAPTWRQLLASAINWAHNTDGAKGAIVKIKIATYLPRWRVGAISAVAASAVSSFTPAPAPAIAIPAALNSASSQNKRVESGLNHTNEGIHSMRRRANDHSDKNQSSPDESDISASDEIGEGADERADSSQSK